MKQKIIAIVLASVILLVLSACAGPKVSNDIKPKKIGISMPTKSLQRWSMDVNPMAETFRDNGFEIDLQYANNDVIEQIAHIENMITGGCDVLIIAACEDDSLTETLAMANERGIAVFAYARLITNTDAVTYYVSFDNVQVGREQGLYIEKVFDLKNADGPFNIEIFTGDLGDINAAYFYAGAMEIMQPYIDEGKVVVLSGQTSQQQTATDSWSAHNAQDRMKNLISSVGYSPTGGVKLDAVLCSNDSTAQGSIIALTSAGWDATTIPVITGQDCDKINVAYLLQGLQAMSVFKNTNILDDQIFKMAVQYFNGETVEVNDVTNNGAKFVDTFFCELSICTKNNIQELLFDSNYYDWNDPELAEANDAAYRAGII